MHSFRFHQWELVLPSHLDVIVHVQYKCTLILFQQPLACYQNDIVQQFMTYMELRTNCYQIKKRWPDALFWKRRHQQITEKSDPLLTP